MSEERFSGCVNLFKKSFSEVGVQSRVRRPLLGCTAHKSSQQGVNSTFFQQSEWSEEGMSQLEWALRARLVVLIQSVEEGQNLAVSKPVGCRGKHIGYGWVDVGVVTMVFSQ